MHGFADRLALTLPLPLNEVVRFNGQTEEQENVCQHQVEKEDVVVVGFPKLHLEYEKVQDGCVQRQSQGENHNHDARVELVQRRVRDIAVLSE